MFEVEIAARAKAAVAAASPSAQPVSRPATVDPRQRSPDRLDGLLQRAVLQRAPGVGVAEDEPRVVEGADGEIELPPLTLGDFMFGAIAEMQRRDKRRHAALLKRRKADEQARLEAEQKERQQREAEERARLEAQERARLEAEEKERLRLEAAQIEKARLEAEENKRLEAEKKRLEREAEQLRLWHEGLKTIAAEVAKEVEASIGAALWAQLSASEQTEVLRTAFDVADEPIETKGKIEGSLRQRNKKKKTKVAVTLESVLAEIRANTQKAAAEAAAKWQKIAQARQAEALKAQAEAAALTVPVTGSELNQLAAAKPTGNASGILYRAIHHRWIDLVHNSSYRTEPEKQAKKGSQHGPFSREFSVRVYGTRQNNPDFFVWADWLVHVHYKTSASPLDVEYAHLKSKAERLEKINHVINKKLGPALDPLARAAVDPAKDQKIGL